MKRGLSLSTYLGTIEEGRKEEREEGRRKKGKDIRFCLFSYLFVFLSFYLFIYLFIDSEARGGEGKGREGRNGFSVGQVVKWFLKGIEGYHLCFLPLAVCCLLYDFGFASLFHSMLQTCLASLYFVYHFI